MNNGFNEHLGIFIDYMVWIAPLIVFIGVTLELYGEDIKEEIFEFFENLIPEKYIENCMKCKEIYDCNPRFITILKMRKCYKKIEEVELKWNLNKTLQFGFI